MRRVVVESNTARGDRIDVRRLDLGAVAADVGKAHVVHVEHDDVRPAGFRGAGGRPPRLGFFARTPDTSAECMIPRCRHVSAFAVGATLNLERLFWWSLGRNVNEKLTRVGHTPCRRFMRPIVPRRRIGRFRARHPPAHVGASTQPQRIELSIESVPADAKAPRGFGQVARAILHGLLHRASGLASQVGLLVDDVSNGGAIAQGGHEIVGQVAPVDQRLVVVEQRAGRAQRVAQLAQVAGPAIA